MSLQRRDHPPAGYKRDHFHGRYICNRCSAETHDWRTHDDYHAELDELRDAIDRLLSPGQDGAAAPDLADLAARANAEGHAVYDPDTERHPARASMWRGGMRQVTAILTADWQWIKARGSGAKMPEIGGGVAR